MSDGTSDSGARYAYARDPRNKMQCHCGEMKTSAWHLVCQECWEKLPEQMRGELFDAYKTENGSIRHRVAARKCFEFLKGVSK